MRGGLVRRLAGGILEIEIGHRDAGFAGGAGDARQRRSRGGKATQQ
jgi:hypothetical protein